MDSISSQSVKKNYFPSDVLKFMKQNASPRQLIKLMQICKYFQDKSFSLEPITKVNIQNRAIQYYLKDPEFANDYIFKTDVSTITNNLWLHGSFKSLFKTELLSKLISKLAFSDIFQLELMNQYINFGDFKFLTATGNVKNLFLEKSTVSEKNGGKAALEEILKCVPNVENITWYPEVAEFSSVTKADEIRLPNLKEFKLIVDPKIYNLTNFVQFMINHGHATFDLQTEKHLPCLAASNDRGIDHAENEFFNQVRFAENKAASNDFLNEINAAGLHAIQIAGDDFLDLLVFPENNIAAAVAPHVIPIVDDDFLNYILRDDN